MPSQGFNIRIVEDHGVGGDIFSSEGPVQAVSQLHRHQRVHTQVEETDRRGWSLGQTQNGLYLLLKEGNQRLLGGSGPQPG